MTTPADAIAPTHDPASIPAPSLTIEPAPSGWSALLRGAWEGRDRERTQAFRRQLGLPLDRPIVMTGHQLEFWHPGVLAKFFACEAAADASGAAPAWVMVDQDESSFWNLRAPVVDESGVVRSSTASLLSAEARPPVGAAVGRCPAFTPEHPDFGGRPALATIAPAAGRLVESLLRHRDGDSAARQIAASMAELAAPLLAPAPMIFATDLSRTDFFNTLVNRMIESPRAAVESYNAAARSHPEGAVAELRLGRSDDGIELPLWRATACRPRQRVLAGELAGVPREELAPRAILLTLLLRLAGCELFIHGTGGGAYDAVTDAWSASWLGETPAPRTLVTATLRLPLPGADASTIDLRRARWRAHHARHNPELLGLDSLANEKRMMAQRIADLRERGADALAPYKDMHRLLERARTEGAGALKALDDQVRRAEAAVASAEAANDRAWPFLWHERAALRELRGRIRSGFGIADAGD